MNIKQGDRVKLDRDYKVTISNVHLDAGRIGTVRAFITSEEIALLQYSYNHDKDQPLMVGVPVTHLSKVSMEDFSNVDYRDLVPRRWHLNNLVMVNESGIIYQLAKIDLGPNELDDVYTLSDKQGDMLQLTRYQLENLTTPVESNMIVGFDDIKNIPDNEEYHTSLEFETSEEIKEEIAAEESNEIENESVENNLIQIDINGFTFVVSLENDGNKVATSAEITEDNITDYYDAIYKINRIIKWR